MRAAAPHVKYPFPLAVAAAWAACLLVLASIGLLHGGVVCWIQDLVYVLAAVALALGVTGVLRYVWFAETRAKRKGVVFIIVGWILAVHAWTSVTAHRVKIAARERQVAPLIDALELYKRRHGAYPAALGDVDAEAGPDAHRAAGRIFYASFGDDGYFLTFNHNLVVTHRYLPAERRWIDVL